MCYNVLYIISYSGIQKDIRGYEIWVNVTQPYSVKSYDGAIKFSALLGTEIQEL